MIKKANRLAQTFNGFHPVAWGVIVGTLLARTGFFMTIPFLGIYLGKVKGIDPATVGAILGISLFIGTWSSFVGGALSDRLGRYPVMIASMAVWGFVFVGFAFAEATWLFFALSAMNGLCRSIFEPAARALLADVTPAEKRTDAFNARYFAINLGGAIGPLIGLKLGAGGTTSAAPFLLSASIYGVYAVLLVYFGVVLALQYPLSRFMKRFPAMTALKLGCLLFGLGLFGLGAFDHVVLLVLAMAVFTSGEILCFVIGDVLIGEIAPEHLRGTYYGASGFAYIGQSVCAWFGGYLLKELGFDQGMLIFGILMLLAFAAFPFFHRGQQLRSRQTKLQAASAAIRSANANA
ncbi:MFS transporter [Cohnella lubricantis]|uniref:MFS transporter n=1 Tax=Cohnella lubricantis TaxID=2163172 RepID=A0A841TFP6_9BACL|nr:MFS transporter [Cohnella lubricantis]MBB6678050.1 MFS transporter [Cohnella lubricantis]MBP2120027.1 MFS family permease [Cohnella lubricantis]